jgi:hypothetical protein
MSAPTAVVTHVERALLLEEAHGVLSAANDLAINLANGEIEDFRRLRQRVACAAWLAEDLLPDSEGETFELTVPLGMLEDYARTEREAVLRCVADGSGLPHDDAYVTLCNRLAALSDAPGHAALRVTAV